MIRTAGILCGAALAMAMLMAVLGVPQLTTAALPQPAPQAIATMLPETATEQVPQDAATLTAPVEPAPQPEAMPEPQPEPRESPPEPRVAAQQPPELRPIDNDEEIANIEHWFAFWSPFRSELAANGFVAQLHRTTGLNYRVVRLQPGVYEVAFAYESDADIADKLAAIATATGLEMPDG